MKVDRVYSHAPESTQRRMIAAGVGRGAGGVPLAFAGLFGHQN